MVAEKKTVRVKGHSLIGEGKAHNDKGGVEYSASVMGTSGIGRAKCSCGALSGVLVSANLRKQWHRDHKEAIRHGG